MKFLDKIRPGWEYEITIYQLHIGYCHNCILGQIFGEFEEIRIKLGLSEKETEKLGFFLYSERRITYQELTQMWVNELQQRNAQVARSFFIDNIF